MNAPDFDPQMMYTKILSAGEAWADKKAAYMALEDLTKTVLADIAGSFKGQSRAQSQDDALASRQYKDHLISLAKARREYLHSEVGYKTLLLYAELRRSQESTKRAEMQMR